MIWWWLYLIAGVVLSGLAAVGLFVNRIPRPGSMAMVSDRKLWILCLVLSVGYGPILMLILLSEGLEHLRLSCKDWMFDDSEPDPEQPEHPPEHPSRRELVDLYGQMSSEERLGYKQNAELAIEVIDEIEAEAKKQTETAA